MCYLLVACLMHHSFANTLYMYICTTWFIMTLVLDLTLVLTPNKLKTHFPLYHHFLSVKCVTFWMKSGLHCNQSALFHPQNTLLAVLLSMGMQMLKLIFRLELGKNIICHLGWALCQPLSVVFLKTQPVCQQIAILTHYTVFSMFAILKFCQHLRVLL